MLIVLIVISTFLSSSFLTQNNIINILRQNVGLAIVSLGMLFVILTGGIELSVGSVAALGSVVCAALLVEGYNTVEAIIITVLLGIIVGCITGALVAFTKMAPFVATLAMTTIARGIAYIVSNAGPIPTPSNTVDIINNARVLSIPVIVIFGLFVIILFFIVHKYLSFGRLLIAIGSNEQAVKYSGVRVNTIKYGAYVLCGLCAIIAGIISTIRTYSGSPIVGQGMELDAIAAVVIGGGRLSGGKGYVLRTIVGVFILALIGNIMNLVGVPVYPQQILKGVIIIAAVLMQGANK